MSTKLFIGTSPNHSDQTIERIYEYTLLKNTSSSLDIHWMFLNNDKNNYWHDWNTKKWFTPFSGFRWAIPHYCNFQGRAIYTDVDMINLKDISELYEIDMKGKPFAARKGIRWGFEFCVMVIDCEMAGDLIWSLKKLKKKEFAHSFHRNLFANSEHVCEINPRWNCLDGEDRSIDEIFQLHFTNMSTQPWKPDWYKGEFKEHPRQDIVDLYKMLEQESKDFDCTKNKNLKSSDLVEFDILL